MAYVLLSLILFCASVAAHILFCRGKTSSGLQARIYLYIAAFFIFMYAITAWKMYGVLDSSTFWGLPFAVTSGIVFVLLVPIYLCFYTLTQLMSPSKKILLCLTRHNSLSHAEILKFIHEEDFIDTRLNDLVLSGCVEIKNGRYVLSASGSKISLVLNLMQMILGREKGG